MIPVPCIQRTSVSKDTDNLVQLIQILILFLRQLKILLELISKLYLVLHASRAAFSSSMLV